MGATFTWKRLQVTLLTLVATPTAGPQETPLFPWKHGIPAAQCSHFCALRSFVGIPFLTLKISRGNLGMGDSIFHFAFLVLSAKQLSLNLLRKSPFLFF